MEKIKGAMAIGKFVFSELMSNIINEGVDTEKEKIKRDIYDRHSQSFSEKIYCAIENSLNQVTGNKYKDSDILYEAIEKIFIEFRNDKNEIEAVKAGLSYLNCDAGNNMHEYFLEKFDEAVCQDEELCRRRIVCLQKKEIRIAENGFQRMDFCNTETHKKLDFLIERENVRSSNNGNAIIRDGKFKNNKKENYIKIWNNNLFLHSKENPKTLSEAFITPDYRRTVMDDLAAKDLISIIKKYIDYNNSSNMLITGVPGVGKTSLVAKIAKEYEYDDRVIILRFRDWDREELKEGLLKAVLKTLECKKADLENKTLILDGYDEIKVLDDEDQKIIGRFRFDIKDLDSFKYIVTSRPAYIKPELFDNVIQLKEFDMKKVCEFYKVITGDTLNDEKEIQPNLEVLGIPVILYMAIMSKVDISNNHTKPELYNLIFAEKGGIFDKFYNGRTEYSKGIQILRDLHNIKKYLKFLRDTAFEMFKYDTLSLLKEKCEIPKLEFEDKKISILDFPIKHLFEGIKSGSIEFIHKSIYEYFAAEYFFSIMNDHINESKEDLAAAFGKEFIKGRITNEILEFLKYRVEKSVLSKKFDIMKEAFNVMIQDGMTYHASINQKIAYKNVIKCEMNVFANMLEILHLWEIDCLELDPAICFYLQYNKYDHLNLRNMSLKNANLMKASLAKADLRESNLRGAALFESNLREVDLRKAYLREAYLRKADLRKAALFGANLSEANLIQANLFGANLRESNLREAYLREAYLREADLFGADLRKADLSGANISEANLNRTNLNDTIFDANQIEILNDKYNLNNTRVHFESELITYHEYKKRMS